MGYRTRVFAAIFALMTSAMSACTLNVNQPLPSSEASGIAHPSPTAASPTETAGTPQPDDSSPVLDFSATPVPSIFLPEPPDPTAPPRGLITRPDASASPSPDGCGTQTAEEAFEANADVIPPAGAKGDWIMDKTGHGYEPCGGLSWIRYGMPHRLGHPYGALLFFRGRFLGLATQRPCGYRPDIESLSPFSLRLTCPYLRSGDTAESPSGRTVVSVTWDPALEGAVFVGEFVS